MIDFHSHILPCVDDGSSSLEMSLAMLREERDHGIKAVVATPHFYAMTDTPERFLARRQEASEKLFAAMKQDSSLPKVFLGAEVEFFRGMSDSDVLWNFRIADTNYVLIEPPLAPWGRQVFKELRELPAKQNLYPIIAHVDRYLLPFQTKKLMDKLWDMPALVQVNGSFFLGKRAKIAQRFLREGRIHLLGSDCHNLKERAPNLGAVLPLLGEETLEYIRSHQEQVLGEV